MTIEPSRDRWRASGLAARSPRPDGTSRRVVSASHDRQLGPLPEQLPTGWHRQVFDSPARQLGRVQDSSAPTRHRAVDSSARPRHRAAQSAAPRRRRVRAIVVAGVLGTGLAAAAVLGVSAVSRSPGEPAPPTPTPATEAATSALPTTAVAPPFAPASAPLAPAPVPVPTPASAPAPTAPTPGPAVVSTLSPGDPGFGWPSTAFGSAPAG